MIFPVFRCPAPRPRGTAAKRVGFTLIELLVVIAIIAILAAILFPVFARARENARRASCSSNLKQLSLGILMYGQDYDEKYPYAWMYNPTPPQPSDWGVGSYWYWQQMAYPYIKSAQVMRCPSTTPVSTDTYVGSPLFGSYGANELLIPQPWSSSTPAVSFAAVQSSANVYMIFDAGKYVLMPANIDARDTPGAGNYGHFIPGQGKETAQGAAACGSGFGSASQNDCNTGRHFDGVNVGFADGHVKWLRTSKVIAEAMKYTKGPGPYNPDPAQGGGTASDSQWNIAK
jgi:prepilin-type N-terminal cleavage/methylation domain-containing protein/prepilin-type processing-associated H-X9-DG protein